MDGSATVTMVASSTTISCAAEMTMSAAVRRGEFSASPAAGAGDPSGSMRSALSAVWGRHGRTGHSSREPRRALLLALSATGGAPPTASIPDCCELMAGSLLSLVAQRGGGCGGCADTSSLRPRRSGSCRLEEASGEHDVDDVGDRLGAGPVSLEFTRQRDPADRLGPGLEDPGQASAMRFGRGPSDRVDDGVDLEPVAD